MSSRYQLSRAFKTFRRASTNVSIATTTWTNIDTALDVTLAAEIGDVIEVSLSGLWGSDSAAEGQIDAATIVSGSPVNYFSSGSSTPAAQGVQAWWGGVSAFAAIAGSAFYTLQAGDISGGTVTVRLRFALSTGTDSRALQATSANPFAGCVKNLGPADPH